MRYLVFIIALFAALQTNAQNNIVYGAGINYTNGAPTFTPPVRTSRVAIDTVTGKWYHFNTPGGWQLIGNTIEEIAGCTAPAYTPGKGDSKVVINNCSPQPELYFYNGSSWVLVGGGSVYAGEGIRIENDTIILDSLYVLRFRTGDTTDLNAGAVSWNAAEQTLDVVINQGAVTGQMFQEVLYFTKNQTGAQIDDGTVVMAAGTTGNSGKILIAPAIADGSVNSEYILGLATQNLPNGGEGMVTHFGKVRGIQTNGANFGETWVDGDILYCSAATPGYLTKVLPTAPNLKVPIAIVIHAHPSNGTLFVRPSHFPDLAQINDVQLSSPTNGQVLTYNSTLSRWENATPANQLQTLSTDGSAGNISISSGNTITLNVNDADASATNELQTLSTGTNTLTLSNGGGTVTVDTNPADDVTGNGASGQISYWNGTQTQTGNNNLWWNVVNNRFGVNTNNPLTDVHIAGRTYVTNQLEGRAVMAYGTVADFANAAGVSQGFLLSFAGTLASIRAYNNSSGGGTAVLNFITGGSERARIAPTGEFSIGTTSSAARLHVVGSGTGSATWTAQFHNSGGSNNALMIRDDGRIGMGTNAPSANLDVSGDQNTFGFGDGIRMTGFGTTASYRTVLGFYRAKGTQAAPAETVANDVIGSFSFFARKASGQYVTTATIRSVQTANHTLSTTVTTGNLEFFTADGTNEVARMTLDPNGRLNIGTTTSNNSAILNVTSTTMGILFPRMTTTQRNAIATPADGLVIYNTTDNKLQVRTAGAWVDLH